MLGELSFKSILGAKLIYLNEAKLLLKGHPGTHAKATPGLSASASPYSYIFLNISGKKKNEAKLKFDYTCILFP